MTAPLWTRDEALQALGKEPIFPYSQLRPVLQLARNDASVRLR